MSEEKWFDLLASLFDIHLGNDHVDKEAWLEDYQAGTSPHDAFYNEFPEYL